MQTGTAFILTIASYLKISQKNVHTNIIFSFEYYFIFSVTTSCDQSSSAIRPNESKLLKSIICRYTHSNVLLAKPHHCIRHDMHSSINHNSKAFHIIMDTVVITVLIIRIFRTQMTY